MGSADVKTEKGFWENPLAWAGNKIDHAVHSAEKTVDGWRKDMVTFGEEHGGVVGKTVAKGVANGIGFIEGVDLAAYDMVAGAASLAHGISKVTDPIEWINHPKENRERVETALKVADTLNKVASPVEWLTNPEGNLKTTGALWDGITHEYQEAAKDGDWAKFTGRLTVDVGSFFVGAGEVKAAEKGAEAANAAAHVVEGTTKVVAETAEGFNALEHTAQNAAKIGDMAAETTNVAEKTAKELDAAAASAKEAKTVVGEKVGPKTTSPSKKPVVTSKAEVNGRVFEDVNQTARVGVDPKKPTLIADRVNAKAAKSGKNLPNGNMGSAHAEVGSIQQAYEAGVTSGADMKMTVTGKAVCGYCRGDVAAMAEKAGLKSLTIKEAATGDTLFWESGMRSLKKVK